jgi:hypothetical protein
MSASEPPRPKEDVVFIHGPADGGEGYRVLRKRDDTLEVGEIRPVQEGRPLSGDLVKLKARPEHDRLFDVEVMVSREEIAEKAATAMGEGPKPPRPHAGPAQVATASYRANWDTVFGRRGDSDLPN